jgi:hypothetical protein
MTLFADNLICRQISAEIQRGDVTDFDVIVEIARRHFDSMPGIELAEFVSKLNIQQYKQFDSRFSDQPRYNFAVAVRTALALCISISYLEQH